MKGKTAVLTCPKCGQEMALDRNILKKMLRATK